MLFSGLSVYILGIGSTSFLKATAETKNFGGLAVCQPVRIRLADP
jgi:hypothetical protein